MEAENYLSSGYGLRRTMIAKPSGWRKLGQVAHSWQPNRLKGIQVGREFGTPFLAATQVYDVRPVARKWLSIDRTEDANNRFVKSGTILVTRSGSVGRPTISYDAHLGSLISHDLLRVEPYSQRDWGWVYSFLLSSQCRAMAKGAQYGHIIKHLETSHLDDLPMPLVDDETALRFNKRVDEVLALRDRSYSLTLAAESCFEQSLGPLEIADWGDQGFEVSMSAFAGSGRLRLDASAFNPGVRSIRQHLHGNGIGFTRFSEAGYDIWVPGRYKRIPAGDGVVYRDSADLLEVSPDLDKRFADCGLGIASRGEYERDGYWFRVLVRCTGLSVQLRSQLRRSKTRLCPTMY